MSDKYVWVKNPKGILVEVSENRLDVLKKQGYKPATGHIGDPEKESKTTSIAVISEFAHNYSGGRYLTLQFTCALAEAGYDVTLFCDNMPPFLADWDDYAQPKISTTGLEGLDIKADIYVGSPLLGSRVASRLAIKYNKPVYSLIFDALPNMKKYKPQDRDATDEYWEETKKLWEDSGCIMLACSEMTMNGAREWLDKPKNQLRTLYPSINSRVLRKAPETKRRDKVVFVSRLVRHKNIEHIFYAMQDNDWELHLVTDTGSEYYEELVKKYNMHGRSYLYQGINDLEKFSLFKSAKVMINASTFEGAGMWLQEAEACGLYTVCYNFPTLQELQRSNHVYYAEHGNKDSLREHLSVAISEYEEPEPIEDFHFENYMLPQVKEIFKEDIEIGVMMIALNEQKFIGPALRTLLESPHIKRIAIVEGAVKLFAHAADEDGLSKDNTEQAVRDIIKKYDTEGKIFYERYGWASNKSELRNRCIELIGKKVNWLFMVDADEVYKTEDIDNLTKQINSSPGATTVWVKHYHFWKSKDQIAVGGQWDIPLPRLYKYTDKSLKYDGHGQPPVDSNGVSIEQKGKKLIANDFFAYHYGPMKDQKDIKAKLKFYRKRDKHLKVKDTWSKWKKGDETQWTHGGGTVEKFTGKHPDVMKGII